MNAKKTEFLIDLHGDVEVFWYFNNRLKFTERHSGSDISFMPLSFSQNQHAYMWIDAVLIK